MKYVIKIDCFNVITCRPPAFDVNVITGICIIISIQFYILKSMGWLVFNSPLKLLYDAVHGFLILDHW